MRSIAVLAALSIAALAACKSSKREVPAPPDPGPSAAPPSWIVYTAHQVGVFAVLEDGTRPPVQLSTDGTRPVFAGVMPGRRVLIASTATDGSIVSLESIVADGSNREPLGAPAKGVYGKVVSTKTQGDAVVVELGHADAPTTSDVLALKKGATPALVSSSASLVAVGAGHVAVLASKKLMTSTLDGADVHALGAATGEDGFVEMRGDRILMTTHSEAAGDVRIVKIDGTEGVDLGEPGSDDRAFGFVDGNRVVWSRVEQGHHVVVVSSVDGKTTQVITPPELDAMPTGVTPSGDVLVLSASGALHLAPVAGGATRLLDAQAGSPIRTNKVVGDRVFYTAGATLKTAKLDGTGATVLLNKLTWLPFFATVTPDQRVVFYRALSGQLEGGKLFSVKLDGTDLQPVGVDVTNPDGKPFDDAPEDQDFEAITPAGRVLLEAEFEGIESHLLIGRGGADARRITTHSNVKFAALAID